VSISQNNQVLGGAAVTSANTSIAITQSINVSQNVLVKLRKQLIIQVLKKTFRL
jgi:hypothetical protein